MSKLIGVIYLKEIKDMFRDRKTLLAGLLIPLLLMPLLSYIMGRTMNSAENDVKKNIKIVMVDKGDSSLGKVLKEDKAIKLEKYKNGESAVKSGKALLYVEIPQNFDEAISEGNTSDLKLFYDNTSQKSSLALSRITQIVESLSKQIVSERLTKKNIDTKILTPINISTSTVEKEKNAEGKAILNILVPVFILLYCAVGPLSAATDLGAGEKERGTLEPLLTTKAGREYILTGKLLAITTIGFVTSICSMIGLVVSMKMPNGMYGSGGTSISVGVLPIILIGIVAIITTMFFGALELAVSIYARSFKEAQTYLMPFSIVPIFAAYGTMYMGAKDIPFLYFSIPMVNVCSVVKELIGGVYNYGHIGVTIVWSIVYTVLSVLVAKRMFGKESVIFRS